MQMRSFSYLTPEGCLNFFKVHFNLVYLKRHSYTDSLLSQTHLYILSLFLSLAFVCVCVLQS